MAAVRIPLSYVGGVCLGMTGSLLWPAAWAARRLCSSLRTLRNASPTPRHSSNAREGPDGVRLLDTCITGTFNGSTGTRGHATRRLLLPPGLRGGRPGSDPLAARALKTALLPCEPDRRAASADAGTLLQPQLASVTGTCLAARSWGLPTPTRTLHVRNDTNAVLKPTAEPSACTKDAVRRSKRPIRLPLLRDA